MMSKQGQKLGKMSLTEMFRAIDSDEAERFRDEDHARDIRLSYMMDKIGLPFNKPVKFEATDVRDRNKNWQDYFVEHKDDPCAFRCVPKEGESVKKIRLRGKTVEETLVWFDEQDMDKSKYYLYVMPHKPHKAWSTIFVVNKHGIHGEIIYGEHTQLTQGRHQDEPPIVFSFDFKKWRLDPANINAEKYLKQLVEYIHVPDNDARIKASKEQSVEFINDYLVGYFESVQDGETGETSYIDYSTVLGDRYDDFMPSPSSAENENALVSGQTGCNGRAEGVVRVVLTPNDEFHEGEILVTEMSTPEYLPMMQKAAAIVTDEGGILSHAAIVAREMNTPCVTGTRGATDTLKTAQRVVVDADNGVVLSAAV